MSKILLPNDVRKILNADNKEIIELCKRTSISPKKDKIGQVYFSLEEVKILQNAKSILSNKNSTLGGKKILETIKTTNLNNEKNTSLPVINKNSSQVVVNNLLETLNKM